VFAFILSNLNGVFQWVFIRECYFRRCDRVSSPIGTEGSFSKVAKRTKIPLGMGFALFVDSGEGMT
jgi:hypothetical protein